MARFLSKHFEARLWLTEKLTDRQRARSERRCLLTLTRSLLGLGIWDYYGGEDLVGLDVD